MAIDVKEMLEIFRVAYEKAVRKAGSTDITPLDMQREMSKDDIAKRDKFTRAFLKSTPK